MINDIPEHVRRGIASVFQWGGWGGALGLFIYSTITYDPNHGHFAPPWIGLAFVFLIGLAINGSLVRSRMRLSDTIAEVLKAGMRVERENVRTERKKLQRDVAAAHQALDNVLGAMDNQEEEPRS